jgi:hypothetical protein
MEFLCFYREALESSDDEAHSTTMRRALLNFLCPIPIGRVDVPLKRRDIAQRIQVDLEPLKSLSAVAIRRQHDEWGLSLHLEPFDERAARILETLSAWKPETFWEMRYPGYGGVDPIGLYGFYFAIVLGVLTFFGFALAIAQTVASFRQVPLRGNSS